MSESYEEMFGNIKKVINQQEVEKRKELTELEKVTTITNELEIKLNLIWKEINNARYFNETKPRVFYNLINDIAEIIKPNYEEIGKELIE